MVAALCVGVSSVIVPGNGKFAERVSAMSLCKSFSGKWLTSRQKLSKLAEICYGGWLKNQGLDSHTRTQPSL
jgi:hypothetical protein